MADDRVIGIPEFFAGKCIFVTGATGFIGKVTLEKLLRSCPEVGRVYLLMRPKKGKTIQERLNSITELPLFDRCRVEQPNAFETLHPVSGDVRELNLGLSETDRTELIENVHMIVHSAASVRFDDPLDEAIIMNTRGTREICTLALQMKKLEIFSHASTSYCNADQNPLGEKLYPEHGDWRKCIEIAEKGDRRTINILTKKFIVPLHNTYLFTKKMAEHVCYDMIGGKIPLLIGRPSIVISTAKEPFPGWIDNVNGPVGIMVGCGKGVVRTMYADPDIVTDYVPVDIISKGLLISLWKLGTEKDPIKKLTPEIYNGSNNDFQPIKIGHMIDMAKNISWESPFNYTLWYPSGGPTKYYILFYLRFFFYQLVPAFFIDILLKLLGYPPILMRVQRRVFSASLVLDYFMTHQWQFENVKGLALETSLLPQDEKDFGFYKDEVEPIGYMATAARGARKYLLKESDRSLGPARRHLLRLWYASWTLDICWYALVVWVLFVKWNLLGRVMGWGENFWEYLSTDNI